ncbi:hypothetical protein C8Q79DRAFT_1107257 [Trametes meyenii]|nr:hypothetical protein C8Q79DRAFT_1107257 [Trametes meyenii]
MSHNVNKITAERNQRTLLELAVQPGNDICADCKARNPRWASHNLGIFICVSCASIHRKMGTHVSKVKSLTMDSWTKEQVEVMKSNGNIKSNALYNPDEIRHPPPTNMIDSERDSDLEKYIRSKYEYKAFISRSAQVAALLGPSRSSSSRISAGAPPRSQTVPAPGPSTTMTTSSTAAPPASTAAVPAPAAGISRGQSQFRSVSQPVAPSIPPTSQQYIRSTLNPAVQQPPPPQPQQSSNPVWNDLAQLQAPSVNSSLPLQYASPASTQPMGIPSAPTGLTAPSAYGGLSVSPGHQFPSSFQQTGGMFPGGQVRSMSLNTGLSVGGFGAGASPGMLGTSPSMIHPQPTFGGLSTPTAGFPPNSTPSPNPFAPQALPTMGLGMQQQQQQQQQQPGYFAPASPFGQPSQPFLQAQPQPQPQFQPQGSPMFPTQQLQFAQGSPMLQTQPLGQPQMGVQYHAAGNPFMQQQQPQQQQFMSAQPSSSPFGQLQQQQQYGQGSAFGGTGWQQQQWGGV